MRILEGIVTTLDAGGAVNVSPMGPEVGDDWARLRLKPYQTSRTYQNLKRSGVGVFHVTDDVELFARAAIRELQTPPATWPAPQIEGRVLASACRWYAFRVRDLDDREPRTMIECDVVDSGRIRDFFGFNRGMHAVIEAAILATRVEFLPEATIRDELKRLSPWVEKTGGEAEHRAFRLLSAYVDRAFSSSATSDAADTRAGRTPS